MKHFRFLRPVSVRSKSTINSPTLPDYIYPESEQSYIKTMAEWKLAQEFFSAGSFTDAKVHVDKAIKESISILGETPAVASIRIGLNKLKKSIEKQNLTFKFQ